MAGDEFLAHVRDLTRAAASHGSPRFTAFLTLGEQALAAGVRQTGTNQTLWGGWDHAERQMLCLHPAEYEISGSQFPFSCVCLRYRRQDSLTHRDVLGAVLTLGLKREMVGDILVDEGVTHLFVCNAAAKLICQQLTKIGRVGVSTEIGAYDGTYSPSFSAIDGTVASLRLDAVVRLAISKSRETAVDLITAQAVLVNGLPVTSPAASLGEGDVLSIRRFGKFRLAAVSGVSKKGRLHITLEQYC